jgi:acyl carrier protein
MTLTIDGSSIHRRIERVFREVFEEPALSVEDSLSRTSYERWDSLEQVKLVIAIEEEFDIKFTTEEVTAIGSVAEFRKALATHLNA